MFDLAQIQSQTSVAKIDFHQQLGSTNDRAIELLKLGSLSTPALVLTENQTAGRGQRGHKWWSSEGSLTFSYAYPIESKPNLLIPVAVALAVAESIESVAGMSPIEIKWPNDLIFENRKIAGILIETVSINEQTIAVIGIGINANNRAISQNDLQQLDDRKGNSTRLQPTSIQIETGLEISMTELLIRIINQIEHDPRSPERVLKDINDRLAYREKLIQVKSSSGDFVGTCQAISESGYLSVRCENGIEKKIFSGSINAV